MTLSEIDKEMSLHSHRNPSSVLEQVMDRLRQTPQDLKVSKTALRNFVRKECSLTLKKAFFQPIDRSNKKKIQEHLDWVHKWEKTDMGFTTNCVFLDESAFHISMKRSTTWPQKGSFCHSYGAKNLDIDNYHLARNISYKFNQM
ncbi:hypothetical protein G6F70_008803 [Rhizopus microsporus]|nr:hypothetical protein G6F71_008777 [Rhizopus microsporus]KAG1194633.1 hypothetical protein G6F70_008803 [Rhizopus microsporus]KAG1206525.1 hypothetical protein G6F69_008768 [Rhizopus microsporus]KAG1226916.1 hypothetical protein G6F67_008748 [Rhizopus microsporus]KAG1258678.1 hypothetical protein G6F68_008623 [Rhizopus microsporus]